MHSPTPRPTDQLLAASPVVRELTSGVDALYLSGRADLSPRLFEVLEDRRTKAQELDEPVPLPVSDLADPVSDLAEWSVEPRAFGKYRYCLVHPAGLIGVTPSEQLPSLRVQPRAELIHGLGPKGTLSYFGRIGELLAGGPVRWSLSRLDPFCDVQDWDLVGDDRHRFVCRAERRDLH